MTVVCTVQRWPWQVAMVAAGAHLAEHHRGREGDAVDHGGDQERRSGAAGQRSAAGGATCVAAALLRGVDALRSSQRQAQQNGQGGAPHTHCGPANPNRPPAWRVARVCACVHTSYHVRDYFAKLYPTWHAYGDARRRCSDHTTRTLSRFARLLRCHSAAVTAEDAFNTAYCRCLEICQHCISTDRMSHAGRFKQVQNVGRSVTMNQNSCSAFDHTSLARNRFFWHTCSRCSRPFVRCEEVTTCLCRSMSYCTPQQRQGFLLPCRPPCPRGFLDIYTGSAMP